MSKLKIGVIGTGNIFRHIHAPGWLSLPEVELVAACDSNRELAEAAAKDFGIPRIYTDYREMLEREELDAVGISTPNLFHSEISIFALNRGIHVFCEKPDAINPAEARKMAEAARQSGKVLMVMRNNRFTQASQFLKRYIDSGAMGDIYTGRTGWIRRRGIPGRGGWFTTKALSGGGPLIDLGVHMIDLAIWLMGNPKPMSVSASTYTKFAGTTISDPNLKQVTGRPVGGTFDVEDLASGFIRFQNGATLQIEFSWASNIEHESKFLELRGTLAGCSMQNDDLKLFTEIEQVLCDITPRFPKTGDQAHHLNIRHFIDCVFGRTEPIITPEYGVDMIEILSAIYESAETQTEVRL
ncbi:Uncharacterized oxidoreductase ycjS [Chlamydia abortus]|jgi:predicted dehydrogenase|uniref:Gfo/Idh/MocA family protein n=1 Tax=Paenibacillus sp. 32O-W TaxID=1695218 RepID=UPI000A27B809|nr:MULTISPECIES: Gfo/Idh/MocA family oxidoreductase [Paenibacillaceae]SHE11260.1 Uncharacterized oxidoreductase ycjS [Chlamydia abortus]